MSEDTDMNSRLTHDPLCAVATDSSARDFEWCMCPLIARVRQSERENLLSWASRLAGRNRVWFLRAINRKEVHWNAGVSWTLEELQNKIRFDNMLAERNKQTRSTTIQ
jgi:hypothetical protein